MKPTIETRPNGPIIVKNCDNLKNSKGEPIEPKEIMALCRCGASNSKPFCDGTHGKINFKDTNLDEKAPQDRREFVGKDITISDNVGVCCHAGFCDTDLPKVFYTWENGKRISHPDNANVEEIEKTIKKCPSGALAFKKDGKMFDNFHENVEIKVSKDGPYNVQGSPELKGDKPDSSEHYSLCRCGLSKNKPFCDGMHRGKFVDDKN
jgi:CDGSH-type Zn-finger protein/ferredoxin